MSIDIETARKIASLSRLNIPPEELATITGDLNKIIDWVGQLDEVNVDGILPLASVNDASLGWREKDVVTDGNKAADILSNAPSKTADYFTVPKVIE